MSLLTQTLRRVTNEWKALVEKPVSVAELSVLMHQASVPNFGFYFMLALAVIIATLGLLANSAPTIIGAMIIAPLMAPIISLSFGIVMTDRPLIGSAAITVVSGVLLVILLAYGCTMLLGLRIAGSEIVGRSVPTLLDMGVAMAAGAAGAFAFTKRSIMTSIAGVAIAVALVPPLAVTGIGLAQGFSASADVGASLRQIGLVDRGEDIAAGAFVLFLTNLASIIIVAGMVFLTHGYGKWQRAVPVLLIVIAMSLVLINPLGASMGRLYVKSHTLSLVAKLRHKYRDLFPGTGALDKVAIRYQGDVVYVVLNVTAPRALLARAQTSVEVFQAHLQRSLKRPVVVEFNVVPVDVRKYRAGPDVKSGGAAASQ